MKTIIGMTPEELEKAEFRGRRKVECADLEGDTKYAMVLLKLNPAVTPADYADLRTSIIGITGVQDVTLLIDHQTKATVQADHKQVLEASAKLKLLPDTPVE